MKRAIVTMLAAALCLASVPSATAAVAAAEAGWSPLTSLSASGTPSRGVMAASQDGLVATTFWKTGASPRDGITYSSTTRDGGVTWSVRKSMYILPTESTVVMSASGQRIVGLMGTWNNRIYAQYSSNAGATWARAPIPVASDYRTDLDEFESGRIGADISADGLTVVAAWTKENGNLAKPVMFAKSTDGGATWSVPKQVTVDGASGYFPKIDVASDGSRVTIAYERYAGNSSSIATVRSSNGGAAWSAPLVLSSPNEDATHTALSMSGDGAVGWVLWEKSMGNAGVEVWGNRTLDAGATWSPARQLSTSSKSGATPRVKVADDGSRSIASWMEWQGNDAEAFVTSTQTTALNLWSAPKPVNAGFPIGAVQSQHFTASSDATVAALTWSQPVGGATRSVLTTFTADGGATWIAPETTAAQPILQSSSSVVLSGDGTRLFLTETGENAANDPHEGLFATVRVVTRGDGGGSNANGGQPAAQLLSQELTPAITLPPKLKKHGWSRIVKLPITTNAAQTASVSAFAVTTKTGANVRARDFRTKVKNNGKAKVFKVRLSGRKALTITIAITAPETALYDDYAFTKTYTMRKSRRWN